MSQGICVCTLHMPVTLQMHKAFSASALKINDMENVAATTSLLSRGIYRELQVKGLLSSSDSAYSWHRHRVFIEAPPPPFPPLCPCQRKEETSPWWEHLWSHGGASASPPFFHPSSSLSSRLGSCQEFWGLAPWLRPTTSPGSFIHTPDASRRRLGPREDIVATQSLASTK